MGRIVTAKYRIEFFTEGCNFTPAVWNCRINGKPTKENLIAYINTINLQMEPGGCNEHIRQSFPRAKVIGGKIVEQKGSCCMMKAYVERI